MTNNTSGDGGGGGGGGGDGSESRTGHRGQGTQRRRRPRRGRRRGGKGRDRSAQSNTEGPAQQPSTREGSAGHDRTSPKAESRRTSGGRGESSSTSAVSEKSSPSRRSRSRRRKKPSDKQGSAQTEPQASPRRSRRRRSRGRPEHRDRETQHPREEFVDQEDDAVPPLPKGALQFLSTSTDDPQQLAEHEPDYDWPEDEKLFNVVAVRFTQSGLIEAFDAGDQLYARNEQVIVETEKGLQLGEVVVSSRFAMRVADRLPRVIRGMTPNDWRQERRNQTKEEQAFKMCQQLAQQYELEMKLICVDYLHGGNRAIFYFSAEGRIDFRQLVRELASRLHTRIEMRQVGVRDASRHVGGIGPCGQQLCCSCFLQRFAPVSIRMAKDQNLVLNPQKVSGVCGRLMCCLTYEQKGYEVLRRGLPKMGKKVQLPDGKIGKVRDIDVLRRRLRVQMEDGGFEVVDVDQVQAPSTDPTTQPSEPRQRSRRTSS